MGSRALVIFLAAFQAFWLNVVVPGHTRGAVTLAGGACELASIESASHCCPRPNPSGPADRSKSPTPAQKQQCAVCFYAARIAPPPPVDLAPAPLELLYVRPALAPRTADATPFPPAYHGRAPPASA